MDEHDEHDAGIDADGIDPEEELPVPTGTVHLSTPPTAEAISVSPTEAREVMVRLLEQFETEGRDIVGPTDFMAYCDQHGRKRSWVSGQVARMVTEGRLAETADAGRYRIVPQLVNA